MRVFGAPSVRGWVWDLLGWGLPRLLGFPVAPGVWSALFLWGAGPAAGASCSSFSCEALSSRAEVIGSAAARYSALLHLLRLLLFVLLRLRLLLLLLLLWTLAVRDAHSTRLALINEQAHDTDRTQARRLRT